MKKNMEYINAIKKPRRPAAKKRHHNQKKRTSKKNAEAEKTAKSKKIRKIIKNC